MRSEGGGGVSKLKEVADAKLRDIKKESKSSVMLSGQRIIVGRRSFVTRKEDEHQVILVPPKWSPKYHPR